MLLQVASVAEDDGSLTRDAWLRLCEMMADGAPPPASPALARRAAVYRVRLFSSFELERGGGVASAAELAAGLTILLAGSRAERA